MTPFNDLSPAAAERYDFLTEELAEAIHAIAKIKRHGETSHNPNDPLMKSNITSLEEELGHVLFAIQLLNNGGEIIIDRVEDFKRKKEMKVWPYFHHQQKLDPRIFAKRERTERSKPRIRAEKPVKHPTMSDLCNQENRLDDIKY